MRCPKCQYLGFEPSPRCKHCGYDFSFDTPDLPSLTIIPEPDPHGGLEDFDLQMFDDSARRAPNGATSGGISGGFDLDDLLAHGRSGAEQPVPPMTPAPSPAPAPRAVEAVATVPAAAAVAPLPPSEVRRAAPAPPPPPAPVTTELPLFMQVMSETVVEQPPPLDRVGMPLTIEAATAADHTPETVPEEIDDRPLIQVPAVLRPPLAVRRTTPDPAKLRAKYARTTPKADTAASGDLLKGIDDLETNLRIAPDESRTRLSAEPTPESLPAGWLQGVSAGKRFSAAAVDGLLLAAIDVAIIWFTLSVCGMAPSQVHLLPLVPFALFFLLVAGVYLVLFTAACGQTIGKMVAGIRVVGTDTGAVINDRITVGQAVARSIGAILSSIPLGAGFWMTLVGDGRSLHDRIAHTRVVRA